MEEDKELQTIEIDLTVAERGEVTESWLGMFGSNLKWILRSMFGGSTLPLSVKGSPRQVKDFTRALGSEKKYIKTAAKYGLDNPRTYKDKFKLRNMIKKFETSTRLKWPFK